MIYLRPDLIFVPQGNGTYQFTENCRPRTVPFRTARNIWYTTHQGERYRLDKMRRKMSGRAFFHRQSWWR